MCERLSQKLKFKLLKKNFLLLNSAHFFQKFCPLWRGTYILSIWVKEFCEESCIETEISANREKYAVPDIDFRLQSEFVVFDAFIGKMHFCVGKLRYMTHSSPNSIRAKYISKESKNSINKLGPLWTQTLNLVRIRPRGKRLSYQNTMNCMMTSSSKKRIFYLVLVDSIFFSNTLF